jgi:peroxiredoxin
MSLMKSAQIAVGTALEPFRLEDSSGEGFDSEKLLGKTGLIIAVMCNHCPYSNALWSRLLKVAQFATKLDINTVAINPNIHPNYPEDSPAHMQDKIKEFKLDFPYLVDTDQNVSRSLGAVCTPDIFLFDSKGELYYHGRLDDNWHDARSVKEEDLREAVIALFGEQEAPQIQHPSQGCSIKWISTVTG